MALPLFSVNPSTTCSSACSFHAPHPLCFLLLHHQTHSFKSCRALRFRVSCKTVQVDTQEKPQRISQVAFEATRKKRKPKPSFFEQIQDKWSMKVNSPRDKFPWQKQNELVQEEKEEVEEEDEEEEVFEPQISKQEEGQKCYGVRVAEPVNQKVSFSLPNRIVYAPWAHGSKRITPQVDSEPEASQHSGAQGKNLDGFAGRSEIDTTSGAVKKEKSFERRFDSNRKLERERVGEMGIISIGVSKKEEKMISKGLNGISLNETLSGDGENDEKVENFVYSGSGSIRLPWKRESELSSEEGDKTRKRRSNTELAERMLPDHELRRLRNVSLRMLERIKVGVTGITQALVNTIHEKWKIDEVVKLKFEEPFSLNMKRTHEILESKTGGLVIWRSGSSVVLYRGMTYNLPCVQTYAKHSQTNSHMLQRSENATSDSMHNVGVKDVSRTTDFPSLESAEYLKDLSQRELMALNDLNHLLDELGPRFKDWIGREPLPVDADLLPSVVRGYKTPFRLLPYGFRPCLRDKDMTKYRRLARTVPPHFALGRNRELQGLANAMMKLWEKSAIAKIAIKRGVQNTCNERMAEELKRLTGGTLLSRNKDFIVFYRGNDYLPSVVTGVLEERRKLRDLQQDEEEQARQMASDYVVSNSEASKGQFVAGTLAETMAATTHWRNQLTIDKVEKMRRDSTFARHASLVRHLEKKLALAKGKLRKAEKALARVQESLEPSDLPDDLETLTDEDRFLFRKIGLSMKPFLLLGRREVYSGTIENMHLHWKHKELVKIIVRGKSFEQVKHIAISLEAESGGVLVSLDKTTKGYAIILYRGKNYQCPLPLRPRNLLTRRQALARSVELQRREALKHHISDLQEKVGLLKSELEEKGNGRMVDDGRTLHSTGDDPLIPSDDSEEDEGEEAYLEVYDSGNEDNNNEHEIVGSV
ncbi:PREDICTED: CRM-domain containing factor [Prunus dulcis]|uniref:PREDICTED: CRM-domain containing factor n=1 Tax=Prunus dulcis TaxID=3755 RepID=A0A5E4E5S8_PRUDU|nr:CRM-domain containing factor CFM3, chloroplastic/mitochondrial [Prunus dulcis]VVA10339.1 PREDICTED: CRM-domain containing factor [Prunus dulcis]